VRAVVLETLLDGYEDPLPTEDHAELVNQIISSLSRTERFDSGDGQVPSPRSALEANKPSKGSFGSLLKISLRVKHRTAPFSSSLDPSDTTHSRIPLDSQTNPNPGRSVNNNSDLATITPMDQILRTRPLEEVCYCCIVSTLWFQSWRCFTKAGDFDDCEYPVLPPGPISNESLLSLSAGRGYVSYSMTVLNIHVKSDLRLDVDYVVVSPGVWRYLRSLYGGGPPIFRSEPNLYSDEFNSDGKKI
jgi:hypothetical protein